MSGRNLLFNSLKQHAKRSYERNEEMGSNPDYPSICRDKKFLKQFFKFFVDKKLLN